MFRDGDTKSSILSLKRLLSRPVPPTATVIWGEGRELPATFECELDIITSLLLLLSGV